MSERSLVVTKAFHPKRNGAAWFATAMALAAFFVTLGWSATGQNPANVYGKGFRKDLNGWIYVHIEGGAKKRGEQLGYLLASETDEYFKLLSAKLVNESDYTWSDYRKIAELIILPKVEQEKEYLDELKGIIAGLVKAGVTKYDLLDIVTLNANMEIETCVNALPSSAGKETRLFRTATKRERTRCSAFIATGSATKTGNIVLAHNTWDAYVLAQRSNIVLDIKPTRGARILMQGGGPGYIHSGTDFAVTSTGLMITETTISCVKGFDPDGIPEFIRMRKATQYAKNIDDFYKIMRVGNNGGYPCSWLVGDIKTNEIAKIELGYKNVAFYRSMDGYYDGENYVDDSKMIREENDGRLRWDVSPGGYWPFNFNCGNSCSFRRTRWFALLDASKGAIDVENSKTFLADQVDPLTGQFAPGPKTIMSRWEIEPDYPAPDGACDAMVTTSELARDMRFWARMDHPDGTTFAWSEFLDEHPEFAWQRPYLRDLNDNPWTLFSVAPKK